MLGGAGLGRDGHSGQCATRVRLGSHHEVGEGAGLLVGEGAAGVAGGEALDDGEVGRREGLDQLRFHADATVGDGRGHHGVLQGGHADVALADRAHGQLGGVVHLTEARWCHGDAEILRRRAVHAEALGHLGERLGPDVLAHLHERHVAGQLERGAQGDGAATAGLAGVVLQVRGGAGQEGAVGAVDGGVGPHALLEGGGGGDDLHGGSGGQGLLGGVIEQGPVGALLDAGHLLGAGVLVLAGELVGVEGRAGGQRQHLAGRRTDRGHRTDERAAAGAALQCVVGDLLGVRVEGQFHRPALRGAARDEAADALGQQAGVGAVEEGVLRLLHASGGELQGVVADGGAEHGRVGGVGASELVAALRGQRHGQYAPSGGDLAALAGVLVEEHAGVAGVGAQLVGAEDLHPGELEQQGHHHDHGGDGDSADGGVHAALTRTFVRAVGECASCRWRRRPGRAPGGVWAGGVGRRWTAAAGSRAARSWRAGWSRRMP